jgi:hypothetical protein
VIYAAKLVFFFAQTEKTTVKCDFVCVNEIKDWDFSRNHIIMWFSFQLTSKFRSIGFQVKETTFFVVAHSMTVNG